VLLQRDAPGGAGVVDEHVEVVGLLGDRGGQRTGTLLRAEIGDDRCGAALAGQRVQVRSLPTRPPSELR